LISAIIISITIRPIFVDRYIYSLSGLLLLVLAFSIGRFKTVYTLISGTVILLLVLPNIITIYSQRFNGPMREIVAYMEDKIQPSDIFFHSDDMTFGSFYYYFPKQGHLMYRKNTANFPALFFDPNGEYGDDLEHFHYGWTNCWVVFRTDLTAYRAYREVKSALAAKYTLSYQEKFKIPVSWMEIELDRISLKGKTQ
jgi:hypothetical protein